jgi:hypothetical protein
MIQIPRGLREHVRRRHDAEMRRLRDSAAGWDVPGHSALVVTGPTEVQTQELKALVERLEG